MNCCKFCDRAYKNGKFTLINFGGVGIWMALCHKHKSMIKDVLRNAEGKPPIKEVNLDDFDGKI